nr:MAG TPA: hypothetical protein [Caudoviricetes sp.]
MPHCLLCLLSPSAKPIFNPHAPYRGTRVLYKKG